MSLKKSLKNLLKTSIVKKSICSFLSIYSSMFFFTSDVSAEIKYFEADGCSIMNKSDTLEAAQEKALIDAKRNAVEMAGIYIETSSIIQKGKLIKDEIRMQASNIIAIKNKSFETIIKDNQILITCHIETEIDTDNLNLKALSKDIDEIKDKLQQHENKLQNINQNGDIVINTYLAELGPQVIPQNDNLVPITSAPPTNDLYILKMNAINQFENGEYQGVIATVEKFNSLGGDEERLTIMYGLSQYFCGNHQYALEVLNKYPKFTKHIKETIYAYYYRAILNEKFGNINASYNDFNYAVYLSPNNKEFHRTRVYLMFKHKKYSSVAFSGTWLIDHYSKEPQIFMMASIAYKELGYIDEAEKLKKMAYMLGYPRENGTLSDHVFL